MYTLGIVAEQIWLNTIVSNYIINNTDAGTQQNLEWMSERVHIHVARWTRDRERMNVCVSKL